MAHENCNAWYIFATTGAQDLASPAANKQTRWSNNYCMKGVAAETMSSKAFSKPNCANNGRMLYIRASLGIPKYNMCRVRR